MGKSEYERECDEGYREAEREGWEEARDRQAQRDRVKAFLSGDMTDELGQPVEELLE